MGDSLSCPRSLLSSSLEKYILETFRKWNSLHHILQRGCKTIGPWTTGGLAFNLCFQSLVSHWSPGHLITIHLENKSPDFVPHSLLVNFTKLCRILFFSEWSRFDLQHFLRSHCPLRPSSSSSCSACVCVCVLFRQDTTCFPPWEFKLSPLNGCWLFWADSQDYWWRITTATWGTPVTMEISHGVNTRHTSEVI